MNIAFKLASRLLCLPPLTRVPVLQVVSFFSKLAPAGRKNRGVPLCHGNIQVRRGASDRITPPRLMEQEREQLSSLLLVLC